MSPNTLWAGETADSSLLMLLIFLLADASVFHSAVVIAFLLTCSSLGSHAQSSLCWGLSQAHWLSV